MAEEVRYHVNPATQRPNKCNAVKRACPLGAEVPHFASKAEAQAYVEQEGVKTHGTFTKLSKKTKSTKVQEAQEAIAQAYEKVNACYRRKTTPMGVFTGTTSEVIVPKEELKRRWEEVGEAEDTYYALREAEYQAGPKPPAYHSDFPQAVGLEDAQKEALKGYSRGYTSPDGREEFFIAPQAMVDEVTETSLARWQAGERLALPRYPDGSIRSNVVAPRDRLLCYLQEEEEAPGTHQSIALATIFPEKHLKPVLDKLGVEQVTVSPVVNGRENGLAYTVLTPSGTTRSFSVVEHRNTDSLVIHGKEDWNPVLEPHGPYARDSKGSWLAEYSNGEYRRTAETLGYFLKEAQEGRLEDDRTLMEKAEGLDWVAILDKQIPGFASWANEEELKRREKRENDE